MKKRYIKPTVKPIILDKEISLHLCSPPDNHDPKWPPWWHSPEYQESNNEEPFND